jgi:inosose dehydratase
MPALFTMSRREMLLGLAGAAAASAKPRNSIYRPQIAAHTSIWVGEAAVRKVAVTDILDDALIGTKNAGYGRVELAADFLNTELRPRTLSLLRKNGLAPSIVDTSGVLFDRAAAADSRRQINELSWLMMGRGTEFVNLMLAPKPNREPKSDAELDAEAYAMNQIGEDLLKDDLQLMLHHDQGMMQDNARVWRYLVAHTEPKLVSLCIDVDWVQRSGLVPLSLLDTAGPRLRCVHLRNPKRGVDQELLRDGDIDMTGIARYLRQMQYDGFLVVELLHSKDTNRQYTLSSDLSLSRWYVQEVFGSHQGGTPVDLGPHVRKNT